MGIVFIGTSEFAAAVLDGLVAAGLAPALAITRPDRPSGRGRRLSSPPLAVAAERLQIALEQPPKVNDPEVCERIAAAAGADAEVIVCAFGALIAEPLLSRFEILNVHPSLLPRWRGAAPLERALIAGDEQTGVSIMRLTAGLDSGPVCLAGAIEIGPRETYGSLAARCERLGAELLVRALRERPPFVEQDEQGASYAEKILAEDRWLLPERHGAPELDRLVRALSPHIGARLRLDGEHALGVSEAAPVSSAPLAPGAFAEREGRLLLGCAEGTLELLRVQPPGGRAMDGADYLRGHGLPGRA